MTDFYLGDDPRLLWSPGLAHIYNIRPWEMNLITLAEYQAMADHASEKK